MNRLIILGNGFDLAHGMKTSYADFIYWVFAESTKQESKLKGIVLCHAPDSFSEIQDLIKHFKGQMNYISSNRQFTISNELFGELISNLNDSFRWVDVEDLYYKILLRWNNTVQGKKRVNQVNRELLEIRDNLEIYLNIIQEEFQQKPLDLNFGELLFQGLSTKNDQWNSPDNVLILNFNYTNTIASYLKSHLSELHSAYHSCYKINHIHGQILDKDNPPIFGYGDEKDSRFNEILHNGNNELLRNVKHYKYLQNENLNSLENFLDQPSSSKFTSEGNFEVLIFGHSCGNSDRTLFNLIFEHPGLTKHGIKIFLADFTNLEKKRLHFENLSIQISRTLNESGSVRSKLLNYTQCQTMPSIKKLN